MPMQRERYPENWEEISKRIRFERAGGKCEWCGAENGKPHPITGSIVVLTVAHLGTPILSDRIGPLEFPFFFQMAGTAKTDEVFQAIRFCVALQAKQFKRALVMHDGAISERFAVFSADLAGVVVPQSGIAPSLLPSGSIISGMPTLPIGVGFTDWGLFTKPFQPASITTKPIALSDFVAAYFVDLPAPFTNFSGQWSVARMGIHAVQFSVTRFGAGFLVLISLFNRQIESCSTDDTYGFGRTSTDWTIRNWFSQANLSPMFLEALSRADFLIACGLIDRQWKKISANNTVSLSGRLPSFSTGTRELFSEATTAQKFTRASIGTGTLGTRSVRDIKSSLADFADFCFHTCIIPQYHTGEQIPYYTPGDKHNKLDVRDENLASLCQRCHLNYDRDEHKANAAKTRERKRRDAGIVPLFEVLP